MWTSNKTNKPSPESILLGGLYICAVGLDILDILKFEQTLLFYSALYFNWGSWNFVLEGLSPQKPPPVATRLYGKTSACFLMQLIDSEKYSGYVKLPRCVKLSVYMHASA